MRDEGDEGDKGDKGDKGDEGDKGDKGEFSAAFSHLPICPIFPHSLLPHSLLLSYNLVSIVIDGINGAENFYKV